MTYTRLARKLKARGAVDEGTYENMVSLTHPSDRTAFLIGLCNALIDKQVALVDMTENFVSKV